MKRVQAVKTPKLFIALCVVPAFSLMVYFLIWPALNVFLLSITNVTSVGGFDPSKIVWEKNFVKMFTQDDRFLQALGNTGKLLLVTPIVTVFFSLLMAFSLSQSKLKERGFYRTAFFFPSIVNMVVVGIIWYYVFTPRSGILNSLLNAVGLGGQGWLGQSDAAIWTIAVAMIWQAAGYYMVMHIAAIDGISADVFEAATIDGAGPMRKMFSITLPLIKNIVGITFIFAISGTLNNSWVLSDMMTSGGPNGATTVLLQYVQKQGLGLGNRGYAMAIQAFVLVVSVLLSLLSQRLTGGSERRERRVAKNK